MSIFFRTFARKLIEYVQLGRTETEALRHVYSWFCVESEVRDKGFVGSCLA